MEGVKTCIHWESLQSNVAIIVIDCGIHNVHFMGYAPSMLPKVTVQAEIH